MRRRYETAETLVYDPETNNRNATRASLVALGFRKVDTAPSLEIFEARLRSRAPDLLLAEITGSEHDACAAIQAVRQGNLGDNPFVVIVATTWRRDGTIVNLVLNSGADDLIVRPVSTTALGERIKALTERRKGFVVTRDYIGPDRRREVRAPSAPCIQVPNPLSLRTRENFGEELIEREIIDCVQRGKETLNVHKLRRNAVQLCVQWRVLEHRTPTARDFREVLPRIDRLFSDMKELAQGTTHAGALHACDTIAQSAKTLLSMTEQGDMDIATYRPVLSTLGQATLKLGQIFAPDEVEPSRLVDLDRIAARLPAEVTPQKSEVRI